MSESESLPLKGFKVVELATVVAVPMVGRIMANFGAEVIKIETPPAGDMVRPVGLGQNMPAEDYNNPLFDLINSGKKITAVNLKTEEGMKILEDMLADADVFTSNVRMKSLEKMGLGYETLKEKFPRLIYLHLSGFGLNGKDCDRPGFDSSTFWFRTGGSMDMNLPGTFPLRATYGFGDIATASAMAAGVMMAVYAREKTGKGTMVTSSLFGSGIWCNAPAILATQPQYGRELPVDRYHPWDPFSDYYQCKDGVWMALMEKRYATDKFKFSKLFDMPELETDPDYADLVTMRNSGKTAIVTKKIEDIFLTKDSAEWQKILDDLDIPNEVAGHFSEVWQSDQAWANGCFENVDYPDGVTTAMPMPPISFSEYGRKPVKPQGGVGSDTDEIFAEMGYTPEQIAELREKKIII